MKPIFTMLTQISDMKNDYLPDWYPTGAPIINIRINESSKINF